MPDLAVLDPGLRVLLEQLMSLGGPATSELTPGEARAGYELLVSTGGTGDEVGSIIDREVAGVPCRVYRPAGVADGRSLPVLVWFHAGGWVIGNLDTADTVARHLANGAGCVVVSVDYRLAPEAPFPAAVDDCWKVTSWLAGGGATEIEGDPASVAVGGSSAGGNLAAVVAILARDEGVALRHQTLLYPVTDLSAESPSYAENGEGLLLTADTMRWFIAHYTAPSDRADWRASPLLADDLAGVAPAHVVTAGFDPLRDEGDAYAARLAEDGVPVVHDRVEGALHDFCWMRPFTALATATLDRAAEILARAMALDRA